MRAGIIDLLQRGFLVVLGSYCLAYFLIAVLPSPEVVALGIYSVNRAAVDSLGGSTPVSLNEALLRLVRLDFGVTLDHIRVVDSIWYALRISAPHFLLGCALLGTTYFGVLLLGRPSGRAEKLLNILVGLPAYVPIVIVLTTGLVLQMDLSQPLIAGIAIAAAPALLIGSIAYASVREELGSDYTRFHLSQGATTLDVRRRVVKRATLTTLPSIQLVAIGLLAALAFVETLANIGGLGSLTIRAVKRIDVNLVLGLVTFYSGLITVIGALAEGIRSAFPK